MGPGGGGRDAGGDDEALPEALGHGDGAEGGDLLAGVLFADDREGFDQGIAGVRRDPVEGNRESVVLLGELTGAQLAAYLAIDERPLKAEGLSLSMFKGCVPVDADTFDVPAVIELATANRKVAGKPEPKYGHREIFGGKPELWTDYSATTHVATGKGIPPFLILYDAAAALTPDQAKRLERALTSKGIQAKAFGAANTTHGKINTDLGLPNDPSTTEVLSFLKTVLAK